MSWMVPVGVGLLFFGALCAAMAHTVKLNERKRTD